MLEQCPVGYLVMSDSKQYKQVDSGSSDSVRDHLKVKSYKAVGLTGGGAWNHGGPNSSEDPAIRSTQAARSVSNTRTQPQADSRHSQDKMGWHVSNHAHNHVTKEVKSRDVASTNGKRRRSKEAEDKDDVWTEHTSSSGRTYYYNKRLDKSQWERPKGALKRARTDSTHSNKNAVASTPASKSSHHEHSHREGGEGHRDSHGHRDREGERSSRGSGRSRTDRDKEKPSGRGLQGEKHKGHESCHYSRKSRSHSGSSSPPHSCKHGSNKQPARVATPSGRSHSNSSDTPAHPAFEKAISGSPSSTPKSSGIQLISPTTPCSVAGGTVPASLSLTLNTTQQLIDHTSLLIEQQQKLLARDTTPTSVLATPLTNQIYSTATPPSHVPLAKKKLSLTPKQFSHNQDTPTSLQAVMGGATYPVTQGGVASPQANVDGTGLHPLQRALLLQNQKVQQLPSHRGVEPVLQAQPTAIPHHMTPLQSHSGSPVQTVLQSPNPVTSLRTTIPGYPVLQPLTPLQPTVFTPATFDLSGQLAPTPVLSSKVLQTPMSKLNSNPPEWCHFPDVGSLERVGPSQLNPELVDRGLAMLWMQQGDLLTKVEQGRLDTRRRRTVESFFMSGQVTKRQLLLEGGQMKTVSRNQRLKHLQALVRELDKR